MAVCLICTIICWRFRLYPVKTFVLSLYYLAVCMMCANDRVHYVPIVVFLCFYIILPHYHHHADVSESIEHLKCCWVHSVENKSILSIIFHTIYSPYIFILWWLWEYVYFISLSSSNRKYEQFSMVYDEVIKQWCALYVFLWSYKFGFRFFIRSSVICAFPCTYRDRDCLW